MLPDESGVGVGGGALCVVCDGVCCAAGAVVEGEESCGRWGEGGGVKRGLGRDEVVVEEVRDVRKGSETARQRKKWFLMDFERVFFGGQLSELS